MFYFSIILLTELVKNNDLKVQEYIIKYYNKYFYMICYSLYYNLCKMENIYI